MVTRLLTTLCFVLLCLGLSAQFYTFRNFGHRDGLNISTINCMAQTDDGYLWLGTDGAELIRYDGYKFEEIRFSESDNNFHFSNLFIHGNDILFTGRYKGFYSYSRTENKITQLMKPKPGDGESLAAFIKDSIYYFIDEFKIYSQRNNKTSVLQIIGKDGKRAELIHSIELDKGIVVFLSSGAYYLSEGKCTPLHIWLNVPEEKLKEVHFGYLNGDKLNLCNRKGDLWFDIVLNERGGIYTVKSQTVAGNFKDGEEIISFSYNPFTRLGAVVTTENIIYKLDNTKFVPILHNHDEPISQPNEILTDLNGDFWLSSDFKTLYKISEEPFTRLRMNSLLESPNVARPFMTSEGEVFLSLMDGRTFVGKNLEKSDFREFNFKIFGVTSIGSDYYVATDDGVKLYNSNDYPDFPTSFLPGKNITFILADDKDLWVGIAGEGLVRMNTKNGELVEYKPVKGDLPGFIYTGQISPDGAYIYFGTNFGVFRYTRKTKEFSKVRINEGRLGSYVGNSIKDKFGTCWFTVERGIVGITSSNEIKILEGDEIFRTFLFYTLNSDRYGNLLVGTNKGITYIKVNNKGEVLNVRHYDDQTGFNGYETHMRSQFQDGKVILVGTVEGLFLINTDLIEKSTRPIAPVINTLPSPDNIRSTSDPGYSFHIQVNNPKLKTITYAYRLKEAEEEWLLTNDQVINFFGLESGDYTLEVRASYDGVHFGEISRLNFNVKMPLWRSSWFVIIVLSIIVILNITLLNRYRTFENKNFLDTKDTEVHLRLTPTLLLFGTLTVTASHIVAPILNPDLELHLGLSLSVGFVLFSLYLMSLTSRKHHNEHQYKHFLIIGFVVIVIHFFWEIYMSGLHPFHLIGLVLVTMVGPYILGNIRSSIIFSLIILIMASFCVIYVENPVYPKPYFFIAVLVMVSLLILSSYLRFDSLEKLIFISGIINRGNVPAIAFNNQGLITYVSENISNFIPLSHHELAGKNIALLNQYIPFEGEYREIDITKEFKDGEKYLVPMTNAEEQVHWIEWSYKNFTNNIKVILGQDVTEKMELEHTYELLVQNAEDFIYRCDINGNFLFLNDISYKKLGYTKEELIGKHSISLVPKEYFEDVARFYRNHFMDHKSSSYKEFPIRKKNGEVIWIAQYVTTLYAAGGSTHITGFIALARDITDIREQQELIREQRDNITSSINYARRIQFNLLPSRRFFASTFREHFIIYKPQAIVSGDFYWMNKIGDHTVLILADCTGHGVPGSFMTLLGINLINTIVLEGRQVDPSNILNELDKKLIEILPKGDLDNSVNDGMEMTICVFNDYSDELAFACAGSRFLIFENRSFTMYKGDNKHIGDAQYDDFEGYSTHHTIFQPDDILYLFTDGFQDQFGGPKDKKFSFRRMLELFESNINLSLSDQKIMIEKEFDEWVGLAEQTDDVSVVAVKKGTL